MPDIRVRGMSTVYKLVLKLYGVLVRAMPAILQELTPAEVTVVKGLLFALQVFLEQAPFPGEDNDPGTPA